MQHRYCIRLSLLTAFLGIHTLAYSGAMGHPLPSNSWSITASLGYTKYQKMYQEDGQTALGRLALGRDFYSNQNGQLGWELGVQNGNTMRYVPTPEAIELLGGLPIQTTVKPLLDGLITYTTTLAPFSLNAVIKGGIAYRRWQFNDRNTINDKSQAAGELQAGLGYVASHSLTVNLMYQGIFGNNPNFSLNANNTTGRVMNIPVQNSILLGAKISI